MIRLLQETFSKLIFEEFSVMAQKGKDGIDVQSFKTLKEEPSANETIDLLKSQIVLQEKELFDVRKLNKRLEKKNKNFKDSIEKLIEEKRQIDELSKTIDEQKEKIEKYELEIQEMKDIQKALEDKSASERKSGPLPTGKGKSVDPQLLQKQIDLLSAKNTEFKAELDRRTRINDQMKREHEAALKDRNELLSEVKTLKQQVDEMRHRLDRSLALLVKKKKTVKETDSILVDQTSATISESIAITTKGTQTFRENSPSKSQNTFQNRRPGGGRLPLSSVGRQYQPVAPKRNRSLIPQRIDPKRTTNVTHPQSKDESPKLRKDTIEKEKSVAVSESIQEVKGKRVVSDIRNRLEKREMDKEYVLNMGEYPSPTDSQNMTPDVQSSNTYHGKTEDIMDLFEIVDETDSCTRKI